MDCELKREIERLESEGYPKDYIVEFIYGWATGCTTKAIFAYINLRIRNVSAEDSRKIVEIDGKLSERIENCITRIKKADFSGQERECAV